MDLQTEKLHLIQWLTGVNDLSVIKQFKALQKISQEKADRVVTEEEKSAIDQGLKSIAAGKVHSDDEVRQSTKQKYPDLFK
ncbi:MAG: hypothetical protein RIG77_20145 [Cyclobacteriaceae bacterium]